MKIYLQAAIAAFCLLCSVAAKAENNKVIESFIKSTPNIPKLFSASAKINFKEEKAVADAFYKSLVQENFTTGFNLIHESSKKGVKLARYTKKVSQVIGFYGKPAPEKELIWFSAGIKSSWLFYTKPQLTFIYKTKLTGQRSGKTVNGSVKIVLAKDAKDTPAKVRAFVIIPGKK